MIGGVTASVLRLLGVELVMIRPSVAADVDLASVLRGVARGVVALVVTVVFSLVVVGGGADVAVGTSNGSFS